MRALLVVILWLLGGTAAAETFVQPRGAGYFSSTPPELDADIAAIDANRSNLDRMIADARDPIVRATYVLERADGEAARGIQALVLEQRALEEVRLLRDTTQRMDVLRVRTAHQTDAKNAFTRAILDYLKVFCELREIDRGTKCKKQAALRNWVAADGMLFRFGAVLRLQGLNEQMAIVYRRLVTDHPRSRFADEARVELGEHSHTLGQHADAMANYEAVSREAPTKMRVFAKHKLGWSLHGLKRYRDAFAAFASAIAIDPESDQARLLHDNLVYPYAEYGSQLEAYDTFEAAVPGHGIDVANVIAQRWANLGVVDKSLPMHRELLRRAPNDPRICRWQEMVVTHVNAAKDLAVMLLETENLVRVLTRSRMLGVDRDTQSRCESITKNLTLGIARHHTWQKTADAPTISRRLYDLFVQAFPDDTDVTRALQERAKLL